MFRKGAFIIAVLSLICTALYSYVVYLVLNDITVLPFSVLFLQLFLAIVDSIYDIIHKVNVKAHMYMLGSGISGLISFTAFLAGLVSTTSRIYPAVIFPVALLGFIVFACIASKYEKQGSTS